MIRSLLFACILFSVVACQTTRESVPARKFVEAVQPLYDSSLFPFYHGVASGDPLMDRVIIWTRVTPSDSVESIPVRWEISIDKSFNTVLQANTVSTSPANDYTVKVDVTNLAPGTEYFYRFSTLGKTSMVGRTKTLPSGSVDSVTFAVVSCANWEFGYFNAFARIGERKLDAVIHLGDYLYEYATGKYGNAKSDRKNIPPHEIVTLADYRTRYSQYHLDAGLRSARQQQPFITIWDDHEFANDVYTAGAQNHQPEEGDFMTRKEAAKKAYYEWMPIREGEKLYRSFQFGNLCNLIMLDERLEGRVKPLDSLSDPAYGKEYRTMLGKEQLDWFEKQLTNGEGWKVIGNQVMFSPLDQSASNPKHGVNLDSWGGYPLERNKISDFIQTNRVSDVVFLTGDTHSSWATEVINDERTSTNKQPRKSFAVELGTTSISSGNANEYATDADVMQTEKKFLQMNTHLKFINQRDHGYLLLTVMKDRATAKWYYVDKLLEVDSAEHIGQRLSIVRGKPNLVQ